VHKLLARQLGKAAKASGEVDLPTLLELVSAAYEQSDNNRRRTDRSISLMIGELDQFNRGLEQLVEERTAALREGSESAFRCGAEQHVTSAFDVRLRAARDLQSTLDRDVRTFARAGKARAHGSRIARRPSEKRNILGRSRPVH
jgi:hypothetical protein